MSDELNWESAFSDDTLDGLLDKAADAKETAESAYDKVSDAKQKLGEVFDSPHDETVPIDDPASEATTELPADVSESNASVTVTSPQPTPPVTPPPPPPPAAVVPEHSRNEVDWPEPESRVESLQPTTVPTTQQPDEGDDGGGFPFRKVIGAVMAIVPLVIAGFVFLGGDGDLTDKLCDEAEERIANSEAGNALGDNADAVLPDQCRDEVDQTAGDDDTLTTVEPSEESESDPTTSVAPDPLTGEQALALGNIEFDASSAVIAAAGVDELQKAVAYFSANQGVDVLVEVGADSEAAAGGDQALLQSRAESVRRYLLDNGIADSRITMPDFPEIVAPASNCSDGEEPVDAVVEVVNIAADDPDGGLNFRDAPSTSGNIIGTYDNGVTFTPTGGCDTAADGAVWWQVEGQGISGWANSKYLSGV